MYKGVITYEKGTRFVDHITELMCKMKLFKEDGYYPIIDKTGNEVGAFICVQGRKAAIRFLEWATDYRGKDAQKITINY
jgi:hypothetical protein